MSWIDKILPILGVLLGWILSEYGKYFTDKKNDKKKLKKLLFNLLELRWLLEREIRLERELNTFLSKLRDKIILKFGGNPEDIENSIAETRPIIYELIKDNLLVEPEKIKEIELKIDSTIAELSEIYPVFAHELNGQYKIKDKLEQSEKYFDKLKLLSGEPPLDIKDWIQPKLSHELFEKLQGFIIEIAGRIGYKTKKDVLKKLQLTNADNDEKILLFIDEYFEKIKTMNNSNLAKDG